MSIAALVLVLATSLHAPLPWSVKPAEYAFTEQQSPQGTKQEPSGPVSPLGQAAAASSDDRIAKYTLWLTVFTGGLFVATLFLWGATIGQLRHLRREFVATHRPRLRIRQVEFMGNADEPAIEFTIVNVGETTATIVESSVRPWIPTIGKALPGRPPYAPPTTRPRTTTLKNGEEVRWVETDAPDNWHLHFASVYEDLSTVLLGYIVYADDMGILRRTGFCRQRTANESCFEPVTNPDYEYED
jgi:hypothetical protein